MLATGAWLAGKPVLDALGFDPALTTLAQSYTLWALPALWLEGFNIVVGTYLEACQIVLPPLALALLAAWPVAREALQMLQGEGLVTIAPNKGASVRTVDERVIHNMYDIRGVIEALLVRRCVARIGAAGRSCCSSVTEKSRRASAGRGWETSAEAFPPAADEEEEEGAAHEGIGSILSLNLYLESRGWL